MLDAPPPPVALLLDTPPPLDAVLDAAAPPRPPAPPVAALDPRDPLDPLTALPPPEPALLPADDCWSPALEQPTRSAIATPRCSGQRLRFMVSLERRPAPGTTLTR